VENPWSFHGPKLATIEELSLEEKVIAPRVNQIGVLSWPPKIIIPPDNPQGADNSVYSA